MLKGRAGGKAGAPAKGKGEKAGAKVRTDNSYIPPCAIMINVACTSIPLLCT